MVRFAFVFLVLALAACGSPAAESYTYTAPETPGGRLCTAQCGKAHDYCREDCTIQQRSCVNKVQEQALIDYEKYMSEQFKHADAIELRPHDFERMTPCNDSLKSCTANCEKPYQSCYENCGGSVDATTSCKFLCF